MPFKDQLGQQFEELLPKRVVSLVPSITETLFAFGVGSTIIGVTKYCVYPPQATQPPRVICGGTKNPDIKTILSLRPDLVICNREENQEKHVYALKEAGLNVWVSYPRTIDEGLRLIDNIVEIFGLQHLDKIFQITNEINNRIGLIKRKTARLSKKKTVFCPIWKRPWMTISRDTYIHDVLSFAGLENVAADFRYSRYPEVDLNEILKMNPDLVLLPDEPYRFTENDAAEFRPKRQVFLIDGTYISWYGVRMASGLEYVHNISYSQLTYS